MLGRYQSQPTRNPQTVAIGAAHAESAAVASDTKYVRVAVTASAYIKIGANPTATTSDLIVPANSSAVFKCAGSDKVSCLQVSTGGFMSITEGVQD